MSHDSKFRRRNGPLTPLRPGTAHMGSLAYCNCPVLRLPRHPPSGLHWAGTVPMIQANPGPS